MPINIGVFEKNMTYRWIDGDELAVLDPIIESRNWTPLNRKCSRALIAEEDGQVKGFLVVQLYAHVEPLFVAPADRGMGIAEELGHRVVSFLRDNQVTNWMATCSSPYAEKICKNNGMVRVADPVYAGGN